MSKTVVALQPHYDDAALSAGGTLARFADLGWDLVLCTVMGGYPGYQDSLEMETKDLVTARHLRWGFPDATIDAVIGERQQEDALACIALGDRVRQAVLPLPDAIYRHGYETAEDLRGGPKDGPGLLPMLVRSVPRADLYLAPLGVGGHVDHGIAYELGRTLADLEMARVLFWEDMPYAVYTPAATCTRLRAIAERKPVAVWSVVGRAAYSRKLDAIAAYRSQLPSIFRTVDIRDLERHALAGAGGPAERFWRLEDTAHGEHLLSLPGLR